MRLPTQSEALAISGNNNACCAFPGAWSTWTSTLDPQDTNETALVNFDGTSSYKVTSNWPGATFCVAGTSAAKAPVLTAQPQNVSVAAGQAANFSVSVTGVPVPTFQWPRNGTTIAGATAASYIKAASTTADSGASFTVIASNASGSVTISAATLTVTAAATPIIPTPAPTPGGPGNTSSDDTAISGFGSGPVPTGVNLALKKMAISSGNENTTVTPPAAAFDGTALRDR